MSYHNMNIKRAKRNNKVLLIYTGGTIGMGINQSTGALEPLDFHHLLANLPEFEYIKTGIDVYQFSSPIDSSDMNPTFWAQLVRIIAERYDNYDGFVILHGTDTMAYTASALSFMLENLTKPVILTGSQLPIGQLRTDGKENLVTSIELAADCDEDGYAIVPEVCIYFNGKLLRGNRTTKQNADEFDAFQSFNYPVLCEAGVNFTYHRHHILKRDFTKKLIPHYAMNPNVIVFSLFPGIQYQVIRHLFDAPELKGIIMRSYGSGNAPQSKWLIRCLHEACKRGVNIVNVSQCISGKVEMSRYDTGCQLRDAGVISGFDTTVEAAITKMMFLTAHYHDSSAVRTMMNSNIAGEISTGTDANL